MTIEHDDKCELLWPRAERVQAYRISDSGPHCWCESRANEIVWWSEGTPLYFRTRSGEHKKLRTYINDNGLPTMEFLDIAEMPSYTVSEPRLGHLTVTDNEMRWIAKDQQ